MPKLRSNLLLSLIFWAIFSAGLLGPASGWAYENTLTPAPAGEQIRDAEKMGIQEKLGVDLDLTLPLKNEKGESVLLGDYFKSHKPVILSLVYYTCPGLCNFHLNGLFDGLKGVDWNPGDKFEVVAVSFDPKEGPEVAGPKKQNYLEMYGRPQAAAGLHFLTADQETIAALTKKVGFNYKWDEPSKQWAHSSAAILVSPEGKITRYLHGIMFEPKDLRLALTEATDGKIGSFVDQMIWYCFMYDPKLSKYTIYAFRLVQMGGLLVVMFLMALVIPHWWRSRQPRSSH